MARDNFTQQTIAAIAKAVGYRCSNPGCTRSTVGANESQDDIITIGVAAHICAASPGGPRYSGAQSREERRGKENGIWLCQNCGRLVDEDPQKFTVEALTIWKRDAQNRAFREVVKPSAGSDVEVGRIRSLIASDQDQPNIENESIHSAVRAAAAADLDALKRGPIWTSSAIELTLSLRDGQGSQSFSISAVPLAVELAQELAIVAPPGTGKTTTLLQLATQVLAASSIVPLYFRLGDWATSSVGLLASLHQRAAFRALNSDDIVRLAEEGRALLLLDGWNELDPLSRRRLGVELEQIRRDWPQTRVVVTTRQQALDIPLSGPRIAIELLSQDQQLAIASTRLGPVGERMMDEAWRTPGVRELISIPLYLSTLLAAGAQESTPSTKEELLRLFVRSHEQVRAHAEALQATLFGNHTEILSELAAHLNANGVTSISEIDARHVIAKTLQQLLKKGQLSSSIEPLVALETLTGHHTLTRSGSDDGAISFQHQQFQEWYASLKVAVLMNASAVEDAHARLALRTDILDQPAWEESVLFAVERISREDRGSATVAHAIRLALSIDPMLTGEMIFRASPAVWSIVKDEICSFVDRWHKGATVDRAVRFMITTGKPEFESHIWPLASNPNRQIQIPVLRAAARFRPSVLGQDVRSKIAKLPEEVRMHLLELIAFESGMDGMDLATEMAKLDTSGKVQAEVVGALQFRGADRHVASLLASVNEEAFTQLAQRGYASDIRDPMAIKKLRATRSRLLEAAVDPRERLRLLLNEEPSPERDANIAKAIASPQFPARERDGVPDPHHVHRLAPVALLEGLRQRLEAGLELPYHGYGLLAELQPIDDGPVSDALLDASRNSRDVADLAVLAGPKTVRALVDAYLECRKSVRAAPRDKQLNERRNAYEARLKNVRASLLVTAVLAHADTEDPTIAFSLASMTAAHGDPSSKDPLPMERVERQQLTVALRRWVQAAIAAPSSKRYELADYATAIGRLGLGELLPELTRLLDEDLARLRAAMASRSEALRRGDPEASSDAAMRYGLTYRSAFERLAGPEVADIAARYLEDKEFGFDAACILKAVSDRQQNVPERQSFRRWPWFDEVAAARASRLSKPKPADDFASPIFAAIDRLARPENDKEQQVLAIKLARIALAMPHSNQDALIARVVHLPQPTNAKQELFAAVALDGQVPSADPILRQIDEWVIEDNSNKAWHKKQHTWEIEPWLELLPFTDHPETLLDSMAKVKAFYGAGHRQRWERVVTAAAGLPGAQGTSLLAALARAHADIAQDYVWMRAMLSRDSLDSILLYVDLLIEGALGKGQGAADPWSIGRELAAFAPRFPALSDELRRRYQEVGSGRARAVVENFFGHCGSEANLVAMVKKYAADGRGYDSNLDAAVRATARRYVPLEGSVDVFDIHPASVASIRRYLFSLVRRGSPDAVALATQCLTAIDLVRDEHGIAENDVRHPDIASGAAWPLEAASV